MGTKYTILFGLIFKSFTFVMTVENTEGESSVITRGDTNMATTQIMQMMKPPDHFQPGDDIEKFIKEVKIYFDFMQFKEAEHERFLTPFFTWNLLNRFMRMRGKCNTWEETLHKCFSRERSLQEDLNEAMTYKKGDTSVEDYLEEVDRHVDRIMKHTWDKKSVWNMIVHASLDDQEMKKKILYEEHNDIEKTKEDLIKIEKVRQQINPTLNVVTKPSYSQVLNRKSQFTPRQNMPQRRSYQHQNRAEQKDPRNQTIPRYEQRTTASQSFTKRSQIKCFGCQKEGHIRRNCPNQTQHTSNTIKCYACYEEGHIRKDCPNVKCSHCHLKGHFRGQCYELNPRKLWKARTYPINEEEKEESEFKSDSENEEALPFGDMVGAVSV